MTNNDTINHPAHYQRKGLDFECHDITRNLSFNFGNVIKYLWRWQAKNGVEDLKKARWYLDHCREWEMWRESAGLYNRVKTMQRLTEVYESCFIYEEGHIWGYLTLGDFAQAGKALDALIDEEEHHADPADMKDVRQATVDAKTCDAE